MTLQTTTTDAAAEARLPLTRAAYQRLKDERDQLLRSVREDEPIIGARLARVEEILARAEVIEAVADADVISVGSAVTVLDQGSGRTESYIVDGAYGSLDSNVISAVSPMGMALMSRERGDVVRIDLPRGRVRTLTILDVASSDVR